MSLKVDVPYRKTIDSPKSQAETFRFLSDFEKTIPVHFPGLETFKLETPLTYHWAFETVRHAGYEAKIEVLTRFELVADSTINMVSVPRAGFSSLRGSWKVEPKGNASQITFELDLKMELALPFFLKAMVVPLTQKELVKIFDRYLTNVGNALSK